MRAKLVPTTACRACRAEKDQLSISEAFVLGLMVADLQHRGRIPMQGSLCDKHCCFPHAKTPPATPSVDSAPGTGLDNPSGG